MKKTQQNPSQTVGRPPRDRLYFESLYHAELETGLDSLTIKKRLKARGISTDAPIPVASVCSVLALGKDLALEEKLRAETKKIYRQEAEAQGELCQIEAVKAKLMEWLLALRRDLEADYKAQGRMDALDRIFKKHHAPD
jgi:hypothetical protein